MPLAYHFVAETLRDGRPEKMVDAAFADIQEAE